MRILPRAEREAMYAVYAFCRAVDDIADEEGPLPTRRAALDRWRADIDALYAGKTVGRRPPTSPSRPAASACGARISRP